MWKRIKIFLKYRKILVDKRGRDGYCVFVVREKGLNNKKERGEMIEDEKKLLIRLLGFDIRRYGEKEDIEEWERVEKNILKKGLIVLEKYNKRKKDYLVGLVLEFIKEKEKENE